ncbi:MAG: type II toxin-antitoxin system VapC family toxin [Deltaproteobacteria bacterium]|nr:type II toxin-antitoxin system VapC family toxin [Deltaproteobacteria bacterium]
MILLDTDIMIDVLRDYPPAIVWLNSHGDEIIVLPGFVVMELIQGCKTKREVAKVRKKLSSFEVLWPTPEVCNEALDIFAIHHRSHQIGIIDVLIGQLAVSFKIPLYTFNKKHYIPIPGLQIVHPYKKG